MIGLFDSGVGGLSVWRELTRLHPETSTLYVADQAHLPYGPRRPEEVREFSVEITRFLLEMGAVVVVVACNTASAAALHHLRTVFPDVPFVGTEPAVKPAAQGTRTGGVGILATPGTLGGELFACLVERYGEGVSLKRQACPGLAELVERGRLDTPDTLEHLHRYLDPMLSAGVDTIVLGCTHYSFLSAAIAAIAGPGVRVVDPAPAVAAQAHRMAKGRLLTGGPSRPVRRFWTTGDPAALVTMLERLGLDPGDSVGGLTWRPTPPRLSPP